MADDTTYPGPDAPGDNYEEAAMPYVPDASSRPASGSVSGIASVLDRHAAELMALDGVVGVALGRTPIGDDALVVYLREASVKSRVPARIEGFAVETEVTGEIDAYADRRP